MKFILQKFIIAIFAILSISTLHAETEDDQPFTLNFRQSRALHSPRDYHLRMTAAEKEDLRYMLDILANYSMISIGFKKFSIEAAGNRIVHIHPLRTFIEMLNDPENNVNLHKIRLRSTIWNSMSQTYWDVLEQENGYGNVLIHVRDFSAALNVDSSYLQPTLQEGDWTEFFELLLAI